jgi:MerR family transcriptional regulator, heat shock protein HspR
MHSIDEPVYTISIVAKVLNIHPQTLRQYEREGLIEPTRSSGRIRLYSQRNIDEIKMILELTRELGVNIAGVDIVLKLKAQMAAMEEEIKDLRYKLSRINQQGCVPVSKQVVTMSKKSIIIINTEEDND